MCSEQVFVECTLFQVLVVLFQAQGSVGQGWEHLGGCGDMAGRHYSSSDSLFSHKDSKTGLLLFSQAAWVVLVQNRELFLILCHAAAKLSSGCAELPPWEWPPPCAWGREWAGGCDLTLGCTKIPFEIWICAPVLCIYLPKISDAISFPLSQSLIFFSPCCASKGRQVGPQV